MALLDEDNRGDRSEAIRDIFANIEVPSPPLQDYYRRLETGSSAQDENTFIAGIRTFAAIVGYKKSEYLCQRWSGFHYPNDMTTLLLENFPVLSSDKDDPTFGFVCPPTWSYSFENSSCVLTYCGDATASHGLNDLLQGPTTIDCGMYTQLVLHFGIRFTFGDQAFDAIFHTPGRPLQIVQSWNKSGLRHNPLFAFYDRLDLDGRIQTRTFYNHSTYLAKHPGGQGRLENTTQIDDQYFIFAPGASDISLPYNMVEKRLVDSYNKDRDHADAIAMENWKRYPHFTHPSLRPDSNGMMLKKASQCAHLSININNLRTDRAQKRGFCMSFNFRRLKDTCAMISSYQIGTLAQTGTLLQTAEKASARTLKRRAESLVPLFYANILEKLQSVKQSLDVECNTANGRITSDSAQNSSEAVQNANRAIEQFNAQLTNMEKSIKCINIILANFDSTLPPVKTDA